ncbi:MAG TPA: hypothetical protein VGY99_10395 [Candidatus Binataceae bacterium]|jgi:hypothetical protein|nr:hypothetical protein [Candidatus Binataceae bacterium]
MKRIADRRTHILRWRLTGVGTAAMLLASKKSWACVAARRREFICVYDAWPLRPLVAALSSTQAHALVVSTLAGLGVLYALIPEEVVSVRQVLSFGVGAASAAAMLQVMAYLFPYSPAVF